MTYPLRFCWALAAVFTNLLLPACTGWRGNESLANSLTARAAQAAEAARVVRVVDADTYDVVAGGQRIRVRLLGVDAPEHDQPFGMQATDSVAALLPVGRLVQLRRHGVDLYGRTLGSLTLLAAGGPVPLDSLLVVRGWAWAYDPNRTVVAPAGMIKPESSVFAAFTAKFDAMVLLAMQPNVTRVTLVRLVPFRQITLLRNPPPGAMLPPRDAALRQTGSPGRPCPL